jgi:hypothetical protein
VFVCSAGNEHHAVTYIHLPLRRRGVHDTTIGHYFVNRLIVTIFRYFSKLMYSLVLVKQHNIYIYDIVIVVSIRVDKILLKMIASDRNM